MIRDLWSAVCVVLVLACGSQSHEVETGSKVDNGDSGASPSAPFACGGGHEALGIDWGDYEIPSHAVLGRSSYGSLVAWPNDGRVATIVSGQTLAVFAIDDNAAASVRLVETWSPADAGLSDEGGFSQLARFDDGLIVAGYDGGSRLFLWQPEIGFTPIPMPSGPLNSARLLTTADGSVFIGRYHGKVTDGEWTWNPIADEQTLMAVLGSDGTEVWVWVASPPFSETLQRWTLAGDLIQSFPTVGYVETVLPVGGGLLFGEVGSCGPLARCQAALEWMTPTGDLRNLADLQVISPTDGPDGAFDLELREEQMFVAHGLSGLMTGSWNEQAIELSPLEEVDASAVPSLWDLKAVREVEIIDDIVITVGDDLQFIRLCTTR